MPAQGTTSASSAVLVPAACATIAAIVAALVPVIARRRKLLESQSSSSAVPPKSIAEFEVKAQKNLSPLAKIYFGYVDGEGVTAKACRTFFATVQLLPRTMVSSPVISHKLILLSTYLVRRSICPY
mmetsp:Transcript_9250/g.19797  ORF Transcript_9250/g.19797 Transcript_9250/m.19797 type:complete len:126 (-) Transcript_9250:1026-1403(-)